ncbi:MAG: hypothetical protein HFH85_13180 [Lachnospiraceae bacterium]|jgi:multiple sugar transport system substrate-binding protein|nr:hypothetical protein [Lachnospiraceae bacterium]
MKKNLAVKACSLLISAAMISSLAGCGNDSNSTSEGGSSEGGQSSNPPVSDESPEETSEISASDASSAEDGDAAAEGEEKYDFGGATIRVSGAYWAGLSEENEGTPDYLIAQELLPQLEEKYNIDIQYVKLEGDDGYNTSELIQASITGGECYADLFSAGGDITLALRNYLVDNTDTKESLGIGSIYLEPATWNGRTYGFSCENMGNCYALVYSREYLNSIGMDVTPTDKFLAGEWSYDDCIEYLSEMKAKLPEGEYPIAVNTNHWVSMAPAANGTVSIDSDGGIHLTDDAYIESLEFYRQLITLGLAAPIKDVQQNEDGSISADQSAGSMSGPSQANGFVIGMAEHWWMNSLEESIGQWGIVPWPWGSNVTCEGDYTTLSDNYHTAQIMWTNMVAPQADYRAESAKNIPDDVLLKIGLDWCDMMDPAGAAARQAAFAAEQNGQTYENLGYEAGTLRYFSTKEDADLYDWMHSRVVVDWGHTLNSYVRVYRNALSVIGAGTDARSSGQSFTQDGEAAMAEAFQ